MLIWDFFALVISLWPELIASLGEGFITTKVGWRPRALPIST